MKKTKGIFINGEWLGNKVEINRLFYAISAISTNIIFEFVKLVNRIDEIDKTISINNFYFQDNNTIDIEFKNADIDGIAKMHFCNNNGNLELVYAHVKDLNSENQEVIELVEGLASSDNFVETPSSIAESKIENCNENNEDILASSADDDFNAEEFSIETEDSNLETENAENLEDVRAEISDIDAHLLKEGNQKICQLLEKMSAESFKSANQIENNNASGKKTIENATENEVKAFENNNMTAASNNSVDIDNNNIDIAEEMNVDFEKEEVEPLIGEISEQINNKEELQGELLEENTEPNAKFDSEEDFYEDTDLAEDSLVDFYETSPEPCDNEELKKDYETQIMLEQILSLKEELETLKNNAEENHKKASFGGFTPGYEEVTEEKETTADFKILRDGERLDASIIEDDLFVAGDVLYKWGDILYLEE